MKFQRPELNDSVASLVSSASPDDRCIGHNYMIEENVSDRRLAEVEACEPEATKIRDVVSEYFMRSGVGKGYEYGLPTFDEEVNGCALLPNNLEPTQKIIRLEMINRHLKSPLKEGLDFNRLMEALRARDHKDLSKLTNLLNQRTELRPSFAALKDDVAADLDGGNWLETILDRLGLYHYYGEPRSGPRRFALMEYTAAEVIEQANANGIKRCFSMPTVLEAPVYAAFFPAPRGTGHGFSVDLRERNPRKPVVREILHVPLDYSWHHVKRLREWRRTDSPNIEAARERHRNALRVETGRRDFGELQSGV